MPSLPLGEHPGVGEPCDAWGHPAVKLSSESAKPAEWATWANKGNDSHQHVHVDHHRLGLTAELERWRQAFREEFQSCVQALQSVLGETDIAHITRQFAEWRADSKKETENLRNHVEELLRLNQALRQTELDHLSTDASSKRRNDQLWTEQKKRFDQLQEQLHEHVPILEEVTNRRNIQVCSKLEAMYQRVAEQAAAQAAKGGEEEARASLDLLHHHVDDQKEHWRTDEQRWASLNSQLDQMQARMTQFEETADRQVDLVCTKVETSLRREAEQIAAKILADIRASTEVWQRHFEDNRECWREDAQRWGKLKFDLNQLQESFDQTEEAAKNRYTQMISQVKSDLETLQQRVNEQVDTNEHQFSQLRTGVEVIQGHTVGLSKGLHAHTDQVFQHTSKKLLETVREALCEALHEVGGHTQGRWQIILDSLEKIDENFRTCQDTTKPRRGNTGGTETPRPPHDPGQQQARPESLRCVHHKTTESAHVSGSGVTGRVTGPPNR